MWNATRRRAHPRAVKTLIFCRWRKAWLLEKRLREKNRSYTFRSASPVIPVCRFLEYRFRYEDGTE